MTEVVSIKDMRDSIMGAVILTVLKERINALTISKKFLRRTVSDIIKNKYKLPIDGINKGAFPKVVEVLVRDGLLIPDVGLYNDGAHNPKKNQVYRMNVEALLEMTGESEHEHT